MDLLPGKFLYSILLSLFSAGVPLYNGIYMNAKQRQTTTIITTTTTSYRILDDSSADEYEMLMLGDPMTSQLTVDVPLRVSMTGQVCVRPYMCRNDVF